MRYKRLEGKGEFDYDYKYDILFFKIKNRKYVKSIELDNIVADIDSEGFITGIQILEASKFLNVSKTALLNVNKWKFDTSVKDGRIEIRLIFNVVVRNKVVEKNPIIIQPIKEYLPNSKLVCEV